MQHQITRHCLHLQVFGAMLQRIASGNWKPGVTLPNEHELAREFGVSSGTIRKALERLEADNLIERRQGRGTFVLDHTNGELSIRFNNIRDRNGQRVVPTSSKLLEQRIAVATLEEQAHLKVSPNDKILRTRRVSDHEGRPHMYEEASLVMSRLPGLPDEELVGNYLITSLAREYGTLLTRATEKLSFAAAAPKIGKLLMVEPCARLLKLHRVVFGISDEPIEWRIALCDLKTEHYLAESR